MEISIDLSYLDRICFGDKNIRQELIASWAEDTAALIGELKNTTEPGDPKKIFHLLHTLKSNYQMVGCAEGIHQCEKMIRESSAPDAQKLEEISMRIRQLLGES